MRQLIVQNRSLHTIINIILYVLVTAQIIGIGLVRGISGLPIYIPMIKVEIIH